MIGRIIGQLTRLDREEQDAVRQCIGAGERLSAAKHENSGQRAEFHDLKEQYAETETALAAFKKQYGNAVAAAAEAKNREELGLESTDDLDKPIEEFLPKLAQEKGASPLIAKVRSLHKELDDAETALDDLGFSCDEDSIRLKWEAPKDLQKTLKEAQRSAHQERERSLRKYDLAILRVWSAENTDEARRVVEALL